MIVKLHGLVSSCSMLISSRVLPDPEVYVVCEALYSNMRVRAAVTQHHQLVT